MTTEQAIYTLRNTAWLGSNDVRDITEQAIYTVIEELKQTERKRGKWTTEEVAELLSNLFGDECACNYNGIDEWLPERCKYTEIAEECPNPKEKHGCWMQFLLQGGADMKGENIC